MYSKNVSNKKKQINMILLLCLIFIHSITCRVFTYTNGAIKIPVSRAKLMCYKGWVDAQGNCMTNRVLKVRGLTSNLRVLETLTNVCSCGFTETDESILTSVFYLKKVQMKIYFHCSNQVDDDVWIEQPNCSPTAYKCILNKHGIS